MINLTEESQKKLEVFDRLSREILEQSNRRFYATRQYNHGLRFRWAVRNLVIRILRKLGLTHNEIGKIVGLSQVRVTQILNGH